MKTLKERMIREMQLRRLGRILAHGHRAGEVDAIWRV